MKIAILGDFHFGYDRFYEDSFVQAERALMKAQDIADVILVAGDIFDSRTPKQEVIAQVFEIFNKLHKKVIVIHGTHERRPQGFTNPVELLCKAGYAESCHLRHIVFEKDGEKVAVYGIAGVPEEYAKVAIERAQPKPFEGAFNIFMFHQNLKELMQVVEHGLYIDDLPAGFDLYIDGHIHKNLEIKKSGRHLLVPGSTVVTQVRKEESVKGFYLFDTRERSATFVSIVTRPILHLLIKKENSTPLKQKIDEELSKYDISQKPIVRIDLDSNVEYSELSALYEQYKDKCYMFIFTPHDDANEYETDFKHFDMHNLPVREHGMSMFKEMLIKNGIHVEDADELFDVLQEDDEQIRAYLINLFGGLRAKR
ncbi:MAG: DNA repair exonuclease [Candidatus Micrarchaeia archaeon]